MTPAKRPPPHDLQAEMGVLGSMQLAPEAFELARDRLKPEDFYRHAHQDIFIAMLDLWDDKGTVDLILLRDELERAGKLAKVGGVQYLTDLMEAVPTSANAEYYIEIVRDASAKRDILDLQHHINKANDPGSETAQILDRLQGYIESARGSGEQHRTLGQQLAEATAYMEKRSRGEVPFILTGIGPIDRILHGLQPGMLTLVGGRSGDGKTALAQNIICTACVKDRHPTVFFSAETPDYQVLINLQRILTGIDYSEVARGTFSAANRTKWVAAGERIVASPLVVDDRQAIAMSAIKARTAQLVRHQELRLVIVDFVQLVKAEQGDSRYLQITDVVQELKRLARTYNIQVLALSQIGRPSKERAGRFLEGSGAQEQVADVMLFLGREKKYIEGVDAEPAVAMRKVLVTKNRHGRVGSVYLEFDKPILTFRESDYGRGDGEADAGRSDTKRPAPRSERPAKNRQTVLVNDPGPASQAGNEGTTAEAEPADSEGAGRGTAVAGQGTGTGGGARHEPTGTNRASDEQVADVPEGEIPF